MSGAKGDLNQRLRDLVRYKRSDLFQDGLISQDEYAELLNDDPAAVARLETYDRMRARLLTLEQQLAIAKNNTQTVLAMKDATDTENGRLEERVVELETALAAKDAVLTTEKQTRIAYQETVYSVCNWIDARLGRRGSVGIASDKRAVMDALSRIDATIKEWQRRIASLEAECERKDAALREVQSEMLRSSDCNHPSDDECGDIDDCLYHSILGVVETALAAFAAPQPHRPGRVELLKEERVHILGCDEYHAHHAPKCCREDCWCQSPAPERLEQA